MRSSVCFPSGIAYGYAGETKDVHNILGNGLLVYTLFIITLDFMSIIAQLMLTVTLILKTRTTLSQQHMHPNGMKLENTLKWNEKIENEMLHKDWINQARRRLNTLY